MINKKNFKKYFNKTKKESGAILTFDGKCFSNSFMIIRESSDMKAIFNEIRGNSEPFLIQNKEEHKPSQYTDFNTLLNGYSEEHENIKDTKYLRDFGEVKARVFMRNDGTSIYINSEYLELFDLSRLTIKVSCEHKKEPCFNPILLFDKYNNIVGAILPIRNTDDDFKVVES